MTNSKTGLHELADPSGRPCHSIFLSWQSEAAAGREEGGKDRPCAIVLAVVARDGDTVVYVLPITHTPPLDPDDAVELPQSDQSPPRP